MDCLNKIDGKFFNSHRSSPNTVLLKRTLQWPEVPFSTSPFPTKGWAPLHKESESKASLGPNFSVLAPGVNTSRPPNRDRVDFLRISDFWRGEHSSESHHAFSLPSWWCPSQLTLTLLSNSKVRLYRCALMMLTYNLKNEVSLLLTESQSKTWPHILLSLSLYEQCLTWTRQTCNSEI